MRLHLLLLLAILLGIFNAVEKADAQPPQQLSDRLSSESPKELVIAAKKFGNPKRGAVAFYLPTMNCVRCHESQPGKPALGPDLTEIRDVQMDHLIESVLDPSAKIKVGFETAQILGIDGSVVSGILVDQTDEHLMIARIEDGDQPLKVLVDEIDDWKKIKTSSMPVGLVNQLTNRQQFLDLVSYLSAIAEGGKLVAAQLKPVSVAVLAPLPEYESRVDHAGLIQSLDSDSLERGAETFKLRCSSCHGTVDEEGSMPTSLRFAEGKFKNGSDPYTMYQTLTHGYGMMNPQRWMVPQQKYEVIHYIREHFLKPRNRDQWFEVSSSYLDSLPSGDTRGPKPVVSRPWTAMDYGPSFINTIEVSKDGSNIAQKGITVRLDDGPGGVESGRYWMMYEHDTMRLAGAWSGSFIDYEAIHFNGTHGRHPKVAGEIQFFNSTGPGWGHPESGSFEDDRLMGRDEKRYGPLPPDWGKYRGMYRYGKQTILDYTIGQTSVLESPALRFVNDRPVFQRMINLGRRDRELIIQVAEVGTETIKKLNSYSAVTGLDAGKSTDADSSTDVIEGLNFDGATFAQVDYGQAFEMKDSDYSIRAKIKTTEGGTIFSQTRDQDQWVPDGKTFFVRRGRLTLDIGWVGAVQSDRKVNDGKWHDVAMTYSSRTGQVKFYIDGKPAGGGTLKPKKSLSKSVVRVGFTNDNFPEDESFFEGTIESVSFYQTCLSRTEIAKKPDLDSPAIVASWDRVEGTQLIESSNRTFTGQPLSGSVLSGIARREVGSNLLVNVNGLDNAAWELTDGQLRLRIPPGDPVRFVVSHAPVSDYKMGREIEPDIASGTRPLDLSDWIQGGPPLYPETLTTQMISGDDEGPFAVDVLTRPKQNPWSAQLRLTGLDFLPDGNTMVVASWDGCVWKVSGFKFGNELRWKRIATGLFQPLGVRWIEEKVYVTCRDQLVVLHDLNGDEEIDWYQCLNSDHQVTEHFHEFAMGLQTDDEGNFYYAKSARHAKPALVPHHGTLLRVSPDGKKTEILASGFRAANGVCINPDGSFVVTDQEGHWNPKNRINWVKPGGFYGNMYGYHDVTDQSDEAMDQPLCWITNSFDRSPSELLWVDSEKWGPLNGSLLNFSYGYGKVYIVPHEEVDSQMQGGMCEFPIAQFPTGVMRGRFHDDDGQLYCCGMFAWAGTQHQPGGLYRIRYTGKPVHLPVGIQAKVEKIEIKLSGQVDPASANDLSNYSITTWDLKRTKNYGSKHYNEKSLEVVDAHLKSDGQTIELLIPDLKPTWGMEINYSLMSPGGKPIRGKIHNSIFKLVEN